MVVYGQKRLYSGKMVVFEQSGCIRAKLVVFEQNWMYSGKLIFLRHGPSRPGFYWRIEHYG